jgi:hypothetical protein
VWYKKPLYDEFAMVVRVAFDLETLMLITKSFLMGWLSVLLVWEVEGPPCRLIGQTVWGSRSSSFQD